MSSNKIVKVSDMGSNENIKWMLLEVYISLWYYKGQKDIY